MIYRVYERLNIEKKIALSDFIFAIVCSRYDCIFHNSMGNITGYGGTGGYMYEQLHWIYPIF